MKDLKSTINSEDSASRHADQVRWWPSILQLFGRRSEDQDPAGDASHAQLKVWLLLIAISVLLTFGGFRFADRNGLLIGFFLSLALNSLVIFYDDWRMPEIFPSETLEGQDAWSLNQRVRKFSGQAGIAAPILREFKSDGPCIFAVGLYPQRLSLYYSTSLLKAFSHAEVDALLLLAIRHIRSGLTGWISALVAIADIFLIVAYGLDTVFLLRLIRWRRRGKWAMGPFAFLLSSFFCIMIRTLTGRRSYYAIDAQAAKSLQGLGLSATASRELLAQALSKLDSFSKTRPLDLGIPEASLFLTSPLARHPWFGFLAVQPDLASRLGHLLGRNTL